MTTNDLFFVPINFDNTTILLGHIKRIREQTASREETIRKYPAEVVLEGGDAIDIPLTVEQATERMYRRAAEFKRMLRS